MVRWTLEYGLGLACAGLVLLAGLNRKQKQEQLAGMKESIGVDAYSRESSTCTNSVACVH